MIYLILAAPLVAWALEALCQSLATRQPSPSVQAHERLRREEEFYGTSPEAGALDRHIARHRGKGA